MWVVKLLQDWQSGQGIQGSICDDVLIRVQPKVVLNTVLQLLVLARNELAILCFEQSCLDAHGARGCFDPLIYPFSMATVDC